MPFTPPPNIAVWLRDTGLTPTFTTYINSLTGAAESAPPVTPVGNGFYTFPREATTLISYLLDGGNRRKAIGNPNDSLVIRVWLSDTGLTPTFTTYKDSNTGGDIAQPPITEIGSGFYRFPRDPVLDIIYEINGGNNRRAVGHTTRQLGSTGGERIDYILDGDIDLTVDAAIDFTLEA